MSDAQISALFAIWSIVGIAAEVPSGALADRFSRRGAMAWAGVFTAAAYALWLSVPTFAGYAIGFALWGIGGSLSSGAFEAFVYDALAADGVADRYTEVFGRITAIGLGAQVVAALAATPLFAIGQYLSLIHI